MTSIRQVEKARCPRGCDEASFRCQDQGGNFPLLYGVGPDGVGGTADDPDVDFAEDIYNPNEGFTGLEDTLNNTAWGFSRSRR